MLLEKAKVICMKLDKIFMIIPFTISKIEIRMRNIMVNNRQILDGISHFMSFYLVTQQFQSRLMASYTAHLKEQQDMEYEAKFKRGKNYNSNNVTSNYTTNYSSNMPPMPSVSIPN